MKRVMKTLWLVGCVSMLLVGCTSTPIAPDGQVTPNDELETMINV